MSVSLSRIIFTLLFVVSASTLRAQLEAAHWAFGDYGGLDFMCSSPQLNLSPFAGLEGGATISSPTGELLFVTNGDAVWSRDFRLMPNGLDIGSRCWGYNLNASSTQGAIIIPHPGSSNLYYIFTTDCAEDNFADGLRYSIVDMSLNNGQGDVTVKKQLLLAPAAEKLAAVFQSNGTDVWLVAHGLGDNNFYAYSITSAGLITTPIVSSAGQVHPGGRGYLKFSPNGERLLANCFIFMSDDGIPSELFKFDKATGIVTPDFVIAPAVGMYGGSFSPNSKMLYLTCAWACFPSLLQQYNLEAGTPKQIIDTRITIPLTNIVEGALQLGIDGKLYFLTIAIDRVAYLAAVENPNALGSQSHVNERLLALPCSMQPGYGLPNFNESYFQSPIINTTICGPAQLSLLKSVDFNADVECNSLSAEFQNRSTTTMPMDEVFSFVRPNHISYLWNFGDENYDYSQNPTVNHTYAAPGKYQVVLSAREVNCSPQTAQQEIIITALQPAFRYAQDCNSKRIDFKNDTPEIMCDPVTLHWDFGDPGPDNTSTQPKPSHTYPQTGDYRVTLTATSGGKTVVKESMVTVLEPLPTISTSKTFCFNTSITLGDQDEIPNASYFWNTGDTAPLITVSSPGQYSLIIVRDNCMTESFIDLRYRDCKWCDNVVKNLSLGRDSILCQGDSFVAGVPPETIGTFLWNNGSTTPTIEIDQPGEYALTITQGNCIATASIDVDVLKCEVCEAFVPNIITPNSDLKNDEFVFRADCDYTQFSLRIFNRWGKTIYTTNAPHWDGTTGREPAPAGIYFYMIEYAHRGPGNQRIVAHKKGWLQVAP